MIEIAATHRTVCWLARVDCGASSFRPKIGCSKELLLPISWKGRLARVTLTECLEVLLLLTGHVTITLRLALLTKHGRLIHIMMDWCRTISYICKERMLGIWMITITPTRTDVGPILERWRLLRTG